MDSTKPTGERWKFKLAGVASSPPSTSALASPLFCVLHITAHLSYRPNRAGFPDRPIATSTKMIAR